MLSVTEDGLTPQTGLTVNILLWKIEEMDCNEAVLRETFYEILKILFSQSNQTVDEYITYWCESSSQPSIKVHAQKQGN